ncbi:hypothetical protein [Dyadobacter sp.]|uniref:hypothetical protein n=1 Tax=Dyadobacter sp. TaxID=1914288 RepID=UPI0032669C31
MSNTSEEIMANTALDYRKESQKEGHTRTTESLVKHEIANRPLSRKAQEAKIFLERNPIPKEFLKS